MCNKDKDKNRVIRDNLNNYTSLNESIDSSNQQKPPIQTTKVRDAVNDSNKE